MLRFEQKHVTRHLNGSLTFAEQRRERVRGHLSYLGPSDIPQAGVDAHFADLRRYEGGLDRRQKSPGVGGRVAERRLGAVPQRASEGSLIGRPQLDLRRSCQAGAQLRLTRAC